MARYTYILQDLASGEELANLPLSCSSLPRAISSDASTTFTCDIGDGRVRKLDPVTATAPGRTALFALRDGVPVWGGIVWGRTYRAATTTLTINASTVESYWRRRVWAVRRDYVNTDQFAIAAGMWLGVRPVNGPTTWILSDGSGITDATPLNGFTDYDGTPVVVNVQPHGIVGDFTYNATTGLISTVADSFQLRTITYQPGKNVYDALTELAQLPGGIEWTCDPTPLPDGTLGWTLRYASPRLGRVDDDSNLKFEFKQGNYDATRRRYVPGLGSNIRDYEFSQDATASADRSIVVGQEESGAIPVVVTGFASLLRAGYPLLEISPSYSDASSGALSGKSLGDLSAAPLPSSMSTWTVRADGDVGFGSAQMGDEAVFAVSDLFTPQQTSGIAGRYSVERVVAWSLVPEQRDQQEAWQLTTNPTTQASARLPRSEQRRLERIERSLSSVAKTSRLAQSKTYGWMATTLNASLPLGNPGAWTDVTDVSFVKQGDWLTVYTVQLRGNGAGPAAAYVDWRLLNDDGSAIVATNSYNSTDPARAGYWWVQISLDTYSSGQIVTCTLQARVGSYSGSTTGVSAGGRYLLSGLPFHD